ncbi:MAG: LysM peptidoglycan-binding domain-containing protein, partial [Lentisphaeria bacterium]|nr:LysM peptidoglycan-binding domain-containing protein [Lentisphaeria bacterium]
MKKISSEKIRNERTERKCCFLFVSTIMLLVFSACTPASEKKEELSSRQKWEQSIRASYGEWTPVETQEETKFSAAGMYDEAGEIRRVQEMLPTPAEHSTLAQKLPSAVHTVVQGETLWGIAHKYYGKGWKWRQILEANPDRLKKGTIINPGLVLVIPH